jgi:hypothetical protein
VVLHEIRLRYWQSGNYSAPGGSGFFACFIPLLCFFGAIEVIKIPAGLEFAYLEPAGFWRSASTAFSLSVASLNSKHHTQLFCWHQL